MKRILVPSTPSTNDYALELLRSGKPEELTVIQAIRQTRGRGQGDARWESEGGANLTVSVILYPHFLPPSRQFSLSEAMALAASDCVTAVAGTPASIKWPNDVILGERKVAGLLIESRISGSRTEASVVGVGLNVNQASFPPHLGRAASLRSILGRELDLEEVLLELHARITERYHELRDGDRGTINRTYLARLHGLGRRMALTAGGRRFTGTITGVDELGRLLVRAEDGELCAFGFKEVASADATDYHSTP